MIPMRTGAALALVLAGCLHPAVQECSVGGETWVCPADQACAQAPTYCAPPDEVGACQAKVEDDACSSPLVAEGICVAGVCKACSNDLAACRYVGWNPMAITTTSDITAVAFTQFGEAYAGTATGELFHYLTSQWTTASFGIADVSKVVSLQQANDRIYALVSVNGAANQKVAVLESGTWSVVPDLTANNLYVAMWIAPNGEVFLVGAIAAVAHFNGTTWTETSATTTAPIPTLKAVWGTSPGDVYAVGLKHAIFHYDGNAWLAIASPGIATDTYSAIWGAGGEVFIAGAMPGSGMSGETGVVHSTGGGAFTALPTPTLSMTADSMWGASSTDVWIVGDLGGSSGTGVVIHWDGVSWTQIQAPTQSPLHAVAGSRADEIFAVGTQGTVLRYTGAAWAVLDSPAAPALADLWAAAPNNVFAVGNGAYHLAETRTWTASPGMYSAVTGQSATDVVAVGVNRWSVWDGTAFPTATPGLLGTATDVASATGSYVAVSDAIYTSPTGTSWMPHASAGLTGARGLWVAPTGTIWLATTNGVARVDPSTFTLTIDASGFFDSIWGFGDDDLYAVGTNDVRHYDGTTWKSLPVPTQVKLNGVWGRTTDDVFAVGVNQTVLHYHGGLWKQLATPFTTGDLGAVTGAGSSVFMTSLDGKVYQLVETVP
ncbi:hypothetical protein BH11MYX1_BH11MYX1_17090 [soil metagenome]